ncbi:chemotaxis protein CheB [Lysobacter brunescens]|uniref:Chemotaxis protein CheB n=1 Tax=Lysobacter brunescens TaxID=262323 RepID=A0ABW2YC66_9GAMM
MADVPNIGAGTRVALLARPGKAADNLADAVRQAGAELIVAVDPAATDEAALRALRPQALLIALEPSIEASLDNFDDILVDPSMIVIFDEADVAAHRSGWDAQRWVRHLSAKLRRDSNVLPPGAENEADWQPSPGKVPAPSAAYANVDMASFTEEAVAHADSVPADGMPADARTPVPGLDPVVLDPGLLDAIPAAPAPVAPPVAAPVAPPPAATFEPVPATPAETPRVSFGALEIESLEMEVAEGESFNIEAFNIEAVDFGAPDIAHAPIESLSIDAMAEESLDDMSAADASLSLDAFDFDAPAVAAPADSAPAAAGLQLDDDAFFLETLSNDRAAPTEPLPEIRFDDFDAAAMDFESVQAPAPKRDPETVLSFEELIARSMAAADDVPASETVGSAPAAPMSSPNLPPPLPASTAEPANAAPAPAVAPTFSLGELSLAPVEDAPVAAPAPADKPKPASHDLSALEARISSLSLVAIEDEAKRGTGDNPFLLDDDPLPPALDMTTPAAPVVPSIAPPPLASAGPPPLPPIAGADTAGVVLIEAGLGGPDPARQLLSSIPADFPAAVLVRLHLQGGRYDRLVAQMERASALPVALAASGASANPGTIYFMPDSVGVEPAGGGRLRFVPEAGGATAIFAALPPGDSAIVFLSGSDPALIDAAMAATATGTLVAAQTPEDCYDGAACAVLRSRGAASGLPVELAGRLAARWPS